MSNSWRTNCNRSRRSSPSVRASFSMIIVMLLGIGTIPVSISSTAAAAPAGAAFQNPTCPSELSVMQNTPTNQWFEKGLSDACTDAWPGVTCDGGAPCQHILAINLTGSSGIINPTFFTSMAQLPFLNSLSIRNCDVTGSIPTDLSSMSSLQALDLSNNSFSGEIPTQFGDFVALQRLSLAQNELTGQVPEELCQVKSLTDLTLGGNGLGGPIPPCLGNLSRLTVLDINYNNLTGPIPDSLSQLQALTELDLGHNSLTGPLSGTLITGLSNLTKLHLSENLLEGALPVNFHQVGKLQELYLDSNQFSGPIPDSICSVQTLQKLRLFDNQLNGSIPEGIGNLTQLTVLFLQVNQLSGPLPMSLGNLTSLQQLQLQGNRLNGTLPGTVLAGLKDLQSIYIQFNELNGEIPREILSLSLVTNISLGFNNFHGSLPYPQSDDGPGQLADLALLSVCNNSLTGTIPSDMGKLGNLRFLDLSDNQFNGSIPSTVTSMLNSNAVQANLIFNDLDDNSWSTVQRGGGPCLQHLNISSNQYCRAPGLSRQLGINVGGPVYKSGSSKENFVADDTFLSPLGAYEYSSPDNSTASWVMSGQGVEGAHILTSSSSPTAPNTGSMPAEVQDWTLFQSARVGADALSYTVWSLKPGEDYMVDLYFAELDGTVYRSGQRVFSVYIQGNLINPNLDIFSITGGTMRPYVLHLPVSIANDGVLEVLLVGRGSWPAKEEQMMLYRGPILCAINIYLTHKSKRWVLITAAVGGGVLLALALIVTALVSRAVYRKRNRDRIISCTWNNVGLLSFKHADLEVATNKFSQANLLGQGAFGRVYKGVLADGATIAIKQLNIPNQDSLESLQNELQVISTVRHKNLVSLIGCCLELVACPILVCQYMPNGNLHDALFKDSSPVFLSWSARCKIALDVARGLHYLHEESVHKIVHRDVKPANILLDSMLSAHIADFGMARLLAEQEIEVYTGVMGTRGYMAPEYALHGQLSDKVDVFSFGVVLLEMVTGRRGLQTGVTSAERIPLCQWAWQMFAAGNFEGLVDKQLGKDYELSEFMIMLKVAIWCTEYYQTLRPSMSQVLHMLTRKVAIPPIPRQREGYGEPFRDLSRPFEGHCWESFAHSYSSHGPTPSLNHSGSMPWNYGSSEHCFFPGKQPVSR